MRGGGGAGTYILSESPVCCRPVDSFCAAITSPGTWPLTCQHRSVFSLHPLGPTIPPQPFAFTHHLKVASACLFAPPRLNYQVGPDPSSRRPLPSARLALHFFSHPAPSSVVALDLTHTFNLHRLARIVWLFCFINSACCPRCSPSSSNRHFRARTRARPTHQYVSLNSYSLSVW